MAYVIGVDIGTQGTKAVLVNDKGKVLAHSYEGYDVETPRPLWVEQWPDVWLEATYKTIKSVMESTNISPADIQGVGLSGLYGGSGIPVDDNLVPLGPCLIWMDRRAEPEVEWVHKNIDIAELFSITGNEVNSYFGFTKILWYKNNQPEIWEKIRHFIPPVNYVIYHLTRELAVDYSSAGNIGGVFDLPKRTWSEEMLNKLEIPTTFMPSRLVDGTEIVGGITDKVAKLTGLAPGTPVVSGGVDAAVATLSAGAFDEGNHVAMMGTSMCWGFITDQPNLSPLLVSMPHAIEAKEKIYTFGGSSTAGAAARWFRDAFGQVELEAAARLGVNAYNLLDMKTKDIPAGSEGLLFLPYFMGERSPIWDSDARGTIVGLNLRHNKSHIFKALMEGVAYSLKHNMEAVVETGAPLDKEIIVTGGIAKSEAWAQIIADVTGSPVRIIKDDVEAPLGDALLAGLATGLYSKPSEIKDWLQFEEPIQPHEENTRIYEQYFTQYKEVYLNLRDNMKALNKIK